MLFRLTDLARFLENEMYTILLNNSLHRFLRSTLACFTMSLLLYYAPIWTLQSS